jgi:glycosyltransferase involved in cell wall biosynthesis
MISFVVPAYNEEHELPGTLAAIRDAAKDRPFEIVVVDDGSTDATVAVAELAGARVISISRRHIAAARNTGGRAATGDVLFFVDADTRIDQAHVDGAMAALQGGFSGGSARVAVEGFVPLWGRIFVRTFCALYFGLKFGAGAFLFTKKRNFEMIGGFDEQYFVGEEVHFSLALRRLGPFKVLREPVLTSGRKLRMYSAREILTRSFAIIIRGPSGARSRGRRLDLWYQGKRERPPG